MVEEFANQVTVSAGEELEAALVQALTDFAPRPRARTLVRQLVEDEASRNPRVDAKTLLSSVSIDHCVNQFKRVIWTKLPVFKAKPKFTETGQGGGLVGSGHEVALNVECPPLMGRLDMVDGGVIYDFKTGEPQPSHADQLTFYALLYYVAVGRAPDELRLVYTSETSPVSVLVPTCERLEKMKNEITFELERIQDVIRGGALPESRCATETCRVCPVRQHCNEYWQAPTTLGLRGGQMLQASREVGPSSCWVDLELTTLPAGWSPGAPCTGRAEASSLGPVIVRIIQERAPTATQPRPCSARILGARITHSGASWEVAVSGQAEVFWTQDSIRI